MYKTIALNSHEIRPNRIQGLRPLRHDKKKRIKLNSEHYKLHILIVILFRKIGSCHIRWSVYPLTPPIMHWDDHLVAYGITLTV